MRRSSKKPARFNAELEQFAASAVRRAGVIEKFPDASMHPATRRRRWFGSEHR
jgi:hypothetical protein